ncbi:chorismate binding family protein [Metarhizium robertsii]|uniref:Salicylate synthase n=2 Tax=Metarhizium robertsii TaxID=568076 RepID=E9EWN6_METRA|nr:Salicylate synthase [Metarhizium robertsii ARSEF 23]EFZ00658.1 Salicylate synthase [Metarhizium robertsii ARSEF 23]EXV03173.1 chorismate binding family protein [Metarhizium robertsii]
MYSNSIPMAPGGSLDAVVGVLAKHRDDDYYAYENRDGWYLGLGSHASLTVGPDGKTATKICADRKTAALPVAGSINDIARAFVAEYSALGRIYGQVGFNYAAIMSGQAYNPGQWPVLALMAPRVHVSVCRDGITVSGHCDDEARSVYDLVKSSVVGGAASAVSTNFMSVDVQVDCDDYASRVGRATAEIIQGKYIKAIPSRIVNLAERVDMLATLYHGRRANTPARSFTLSHAGMQATGFSPEVLLSIKEQVVATEAVAGTRLVEGADPEPARDALMNDPKEVMEHAIAIKGSIRRLRRICTPESLAVKDFMSVVPRGNVQHLYSCVTGTLESGKDGWDALPGLVANITVPGIPGRGNMEAIETFEPHPRDMYCGAVLMLEPAAGLFEATLVLRTVFQDQQRQWLQAGAGVTSLSRPEREFTETCEKLGSIFPYLVAETKPWGELKGSHLVN